MHLLMILLATIIAGTLRQVILPNHRNWQIYWLKSLFLFVFPPLLLLTTAIAIIFMGHHGAMLGLAIGWYGYSLALFLLIYSAVKLIQLAYQGYRTIKKIENYPYQQIAGAKAKLLNTSFPYSAEIGFWQSQLVISQGLIDTLDEQHLQAVIAHEQAHYYYRDTFWFFWLGWLKQVFIWLPNTKVLWEELLFLREIRADNRAKQQIDPILLAESLLSVAKAPLIPPQILTANLSCTVYPDRLSARIDALLEENNKSDYNLGYWWNSIIFLLALIPLLTVP
ncbi:MAG: M56 family peptidase, partial [Cyanobacteria bacterium J083]